VTSHLGRPGRREVERLAEALAEVALGSVIERVWRPTQTTLLIELRGLKALVETGPKPRLFIDLETSAPWVAVTNRWPETPAAPDRETLLLRKHLEGQRVVAFGVEADRRLVFSLHGGGELVIQLAGRYPQLGVVEAGVTQVALLPTRAVRDEDSPALRDEALPHSDLDTRAWLAVMALDRWAAADLRALEARRRQLFSLARGALERKRRAIVKLERDLEKSDEADATRHQGELLKSALHRVRPQSDQIEVVDWASPDQRTVAIPLDPSLTPVENLQRIFNRYKKLARAAELVLPHLEASLDQAKHFDSLATALEAAPTLGDLDALAAALDQAGVRPQAPPVRGEEHARLPYRRFTSADGTELLVGRNARDNDALTFRVARGADIFLHARDVPGSHVILRRVGRADVDPEALLDAANLAAFSSRARHDTVVDVLWTERKHVRKVKGGAPGLVQTAAPRTLAVRIEPSRIERLYRTLDPHEREGRDTR
jgi:predicted ribosome quality control (RQC) complex YloA/Tae2 family protein